MDILNLGAGVQSSTILLMSIHGDLPPLDCAIFADTGWEPTEVYEWMDWLGFMARPHFPVYRVSAGNIRGETLAAIREGRRSETPPVWSESGASSAPAIRKCTRHYKIRPIERKAKELAGIGRGRDPLPDAPVVRQWIGISSDEMERMVCDGQSWHDFWHPLIESAPGIPRLPGYSRADCFTWLRLHDYPMPPRSACIGCPYHDNAEWRHIRSRPREWADAVDYDRQLRAHGNLPGMRNAAYLHSSLVPLDEAPIDASEAQQSWIECSGGCFT
jgi:hypothetical protein